MMLWYNSQMTFQLIEGANATGPIFQRWLSMMSKFKHDFELRRVIFGLAQVIRTPSSSLPAIIQQRLPVIAQ